MMMTNEGRSAYCRLMRIADTGSQSVAHENQDDDEDDDEGKGDDEDDDDEADDGGGSTYISDRLI